MPKIAKIVPRKCYDSNSNPTIEIEVNLDNGISAMSIAQKSLFDTREYMRHYTTNYYGKNLLGEGINKFYEEGIDKTIEKLDEKVIPELISLNVYNQEGVDNKLSTLIKSNREGFNFAINTSLAISNAVVKAAAKANNISVFKCIRELFSRNKYYEIPVPMINIFDGGIFTNNNLIFQSIMIVPVGAKSFKESLRIGGEVFHANKKVLSANKLSSSIGDFGGYAPLFCLKDDPNVVNWEAIVTEALDLVMKSISDAGYKPGSDVLLSVNVAADSNFYDERFRYGLTNENNRQVEITRKEIISFYKDSAEKYPIILIEDGFAADDEVGWLELKNTCGNKLKVAGCEIFSNQGLELDMGKMAPADVSNGAVISLDRVSTLSELFDIVNFTKKNRLKSIISSGLGDNEDDIVSDISVGCNIEVIKAGGFCRTEKMAKYNQLLRIEEELGKDAYFYPHNLEE